MLVMLKDRFISSKKRMDLGIKRINFSVKI